jgi:hypothetical protein
MLIDKCTSEKHLSLNTTAVSCVFFCIFFFFSLSLSKIFVPNIKRCCIYLQMRPFCHERVGGAFIGPIATSRLSTLAINSEVCVWIFYGMVCGYFSFFVIVRANIGMSLVLRWLSSWNVSHFAFRRMAK